MANRISESELILPSLYLMSLNNGSITTSELHEKLRLIMKPSGEDLEILDGRNDDKFSQKVRNLVAHRTFDRYGYAEYDYGIINITTEGENYLKTNQEILKYLLINDFEYDDIKSNLIKISATKKKIETFDENIIVQEGLKKVTETEAYNRSSTLRNYAIRYYTKDNDIHCHCCNFSFKEFYGKKLGEGYIEIHHAKPIFKYEDEDIEKTLEKAVSNLIPICSNCHRIIHRNWKKPLEIQTLMNSIDQNGIFNKRPISI